jgi:hypothetical protein
MTGTSIRGFCLFTLVFLVFYLTVVRVSDSHHRLPRVFAVHRAA